MCTHQSTSRSTAGMRLCNRHDQATLYASRPKGPSENHRLPTVGTFTCCCQPPLQPDKSFVRGLSDPRAHMMCLQPSLRCSTNYVLRQSVSKNGHSCYNHHAKQNQSCTHANGCSAATDNPRCPSMPVQPSTVGPKHVSRYQDGDQTLELHLPRIGIQFCKSFLDAVHTH
jgi:hypothetical protein